MVLVLELASVLHYNDVQRVEIVALNRKNSVNSCQEGLVIGILDVPDVVVQHAEQQFLLIPTKSFYQELIVM